MKYFLPLATTISCTFVNKRKYGFEILFPSGPCFPDEMNFWLRELIAIRHDGEIIRKKKMALTDRCIIINSR